MLGIKVKIMKGWDPEGRTGPAKPLPDVVTIVEPKQESSSALAGQPISESKIPQDIAAPQPQVVQQQEEQAVSVDSDAIEIKYVN